jgi:ABC-2 type transport system ATP-binding protein
MSAMLELTDLRKRFGRTDAVDGLTLTVPAGSITAFLGPNGAGKTTTIKCLLNLHRPDGGSAKVLGTDSTKLGPEEFQRIGYVSENQELPEWMTVRQFLDYCRPMYPTWDRDFEAKMLKEFDLPLTTTLKALSRGMKMKASLLSSLAYRPQLVVLDEPFSGLDPLVRDEFIHGLLELTEQEGWTVFVSSHDIEEVERLTDRVAIIHQGRLQLDESHESLQGRFRRVELQVEDQAAPPLAKPDEWINLAADGRMVRFVHSRFRADALPDEVAKAYGNAKAETYSMTLREIFVALARKYRLDGNRNGSAQEEGK